MSSVDIRSRVEARMKQLKFTQRVLASKMGITPQELNGFLRGRQPISLPKLEKIFEILGL